MTEGSGTIVGITGNMVWVRTAGNVMQSEVAYILHGAERLRAEVVRISDDVAVMQVFESTRGLKVGDTVELTGQLLSVRLGPGLLGRIYDGLQNPLPELAEVAGFFLPRGMAIDPLDREQRWRFTPTARSGDVVRGGYPLGHVPEGPFEHRIMVPFGLQGDYTVDTIAEPGEYGADDPVAQLRDDQGDRTAVGLSFDWPVKVPITAYLEELVPSSPLATKVRIIDTLFPIAKGGTFCVPGPFGAGKTILQQTISRYAEVDVVIVAACGERAGEVVETLREFPKLIDPRTGRSLIERTVIIVNTSSMPVAAREASLYTAATLGEYYRQMGLDVLMLADSTSRWAQAMREASGRLGEIPGEEAFPAYLESRIAEFYERSGVVELANGDVGSLTISGTVSPAGGNFEEPVTQATLKVVGAFLGLSRDRANARRFPSLHPLESWSRYQGFLPPDAVQEARDFLFRGDDVRQMMMVVGEEGTSLEDFLVYLKAEFFDSAYLQQNSFDDVDGATSSARQQHVFSTIHQILMTPFSFPDNEAARAFFHRLRQACVDWNYMKMDSEPFAQQEAMITALVQEHASA